jgi:hypothetical protein
MRENEVSQNRAAVHQFSGGDVQVKRRERWPAPLKRRPLFESSKFMVNVKFRLRLPTYRDNGINRVVDLQLHRLPKEGQDQI